MRVLAVPFEQSKTAPERRVDLRLSVPLARTLHGLTEALGVPRPCDALRHLLHEISVGQTDPALVELVQAWPALTDQQRAAIAAIVTEQPAHA